MKTDACSSSHYYILVHHLEHCHAVETIDHERQPISTISYSAQHTCNALCTRKRQLMRVSLALGFSTVQYILVTVTLRTIKSPPKVSEW